MTERGFRIWFGLVAVVAIIVIAATFVLLILTGGNPLPAGRACHGVQLVHRTDGGADTYSVECK